MYETSTCSRVSQKGNPETSAEELLCRICYSYENPLGSTKDLISPCGCKGTIKYVHGHCLRLWRFGGKMIRDIKICEQCFCEYKVKDERKTSATMVSLSTVAIILSFLLITNIFLSSTVDTIAFIIKDVENIFLEDHVSGLLDEKGHLLNEMECIPAMLRKTSGYTVQRTSALNGRVRMVCLEKNKVLALKRIHLLDPYNYVVFSSISVLALVYAIVSERASLLLLGILPALWRVLAFGTLIDWAVYMVIIVCTYMRMYMRLYKHLDNYCMYVVNIY